MQDFPEKTGGFRVMPLLVRDLRKNEIARCDIIERPVIMDPLISPPHDLSNGQISPDLLSFLAFMQRLGVILHNPIVALACRPAAPISPRS